MGIPTRYNPLGIRKDDGGYGPQDYIVYMSCNGYKEKAESGQTIEYTNTSASDFEIYKGVSCFNIQGSAKLMYVSNFSLNYNKQFTESIWLCSTEIQPRFPRFMCLGNDSRYSSLVIETYRNSLNLCVGGHSLDRDTGYTTKLNEWYHVVQTYNGNQLKLYVNGNLVYTYYSSVINVNQNIFSIGGSTGEDPGDYVIGKIAGARLYNRVLTDAEITTLSQEYHPQYTITAQDLNCSFYQKNETFGITYSSIMTPTFEIIEGSLPNTITFNTANGQFSGKGLTDDDHVYNLKVRITAPNSTPAECNVTIHTYKTARISITGKSFTFYTDGSENSTFEYTSDEAVTFAVDSGSSLPNGITMNGNAFYSDGTTTAGSYSVVVIGTSEHNQTGVTATMNFTINANVITISTSSLKFFVDRGATSKQIKYATSKHTITPVYSMTGTLPAGVTFDASTGTFTNDATQTEATSGTVSVTVASSTGRSSTDTKTINLFVVMSDPIPSGYVFYMPMTSMNEFEAADPNVTTENWDGSYPVEFTTRYELKCSHFYTTPYRGIKIDHIENCFPFGVTPRTVSFWFSSDNINFSGMRTIMQHQYQDGRAGSSYTLSFMDNGLMIIAYANSTDTITQGVYSQSKPNNVGWHNFCITSYNNENGLLQGEVYLDGSLAYQGHGGAAMNTVHRWPYAVIGGYSYQSLWNRTLDGYMAGLRIYNRVLTQSEIQQLAAEFTPTDR